VDIRHRVSREAGAVRANPTQIHQVLMNLCTNAAHSMQMQGGVLQVEVAPEILDEDMVADLPDCSPGTYVKLTVRDTGHGIDPSTQARIFDPYFTTKEKGVGTGLGLAVVHGIIKACNGGIQVASEVGVGTVIDVYLPQVDPPTAGETMRPTPLPMGSERILFVDDEEALVITTRRMLERLGYRVTVSISSRDALERFTRHPNTFDLVITDQTMPHLTGDQLARRMLELRPGTPIILCTGFSETMTEEKALELGVSSFLMKPLVMRTLATAVRSALDRSRR
jgi:CheY-like chemotaxis protein/anti-sigma regulatory factor (Ser/Thr protein kinase)